MSEKAIEIIARFFAYPLPVPGGGDFVRARGILNALKAARIAVVELPELYIDELGAQCWPVTQHWNRAPSRDGEVRIRVTDGKISTTSVSNPNDCPEDARSLAVALLAAVDAAEAVSHDAAAAEREIVQ